MSQKRDICCGISRLAAAISFAASLYGCSANPSLDPKSVAESSSDAAAATEKARVAQAPVPSPRAAAPAANPDPATAFALEGLRVLEEAGQTIILAGFSDPVTQYRHFTLSMPSRIVLDVFAPVEPMAEQENFRVTTSWINALKLNTREGLMRLVVEVAAGSVPEYGIEPEGDGLKIVIGPRRPEAEAKKNIILVRNGRRVESSRAAAGQESEPVTSPEPQSSVAKKEQYTGQKISLDFKDADIKNVFRLLAEVSGLNIVVTDDVVKKVTVRLVDVPWDQAMDLLLETNGLGKEQVGNVVRISTVERLRSERDAIRQALEAEEKLEPLQGAFMTVNYAKATEVAGKIKNAKVLTNRGEIIADDRTNKIFIRDISAAVGQARDLVNQFDVRTPQILIESNLIETTPSFARALGFRFKFRKDGTTFSSAAGAGSPFSPDAAAAGLPPTGLGLTISTLEDKLGAIRDLATALEAAEDEGNIRIISRPSVVTLNNVPSTIQSLRVIRIALPSGTTNIASGTGSAAGSAIATEEVNVGIILTVTPQVSSDGFVLLNINVKSSSIAGSATVSGTAGVIPFDELTREAISNVLVRAGETVVIGGIMKDTRSEEESGVPYLKNIPVLGWLFKSVRFQKDFEELMVFITPRVISAGAKDLPTAEQLWRGAMKKTEGDEPLISP